MTSYYMGELEVHNSHTAIPETAHQELFLSMAPEEWARLHITDRKRGFRKEKFLYLYALKRKLFIFFLRFLEKKFKIKLLAKEKSPPFELRFQHVINQLLRQKIISRVYPAAHYPDLPCLPFYIVRVNPVPNPLGRGKTYLTTSACSGCAPDANDAIASALAETLERYSLCWSNPPKIIVGSHESLKHKGAVDPLGFKSFSDRQLSDPAFRERHYFDRTTPFEWIEATSLLTGKKHFVPAQLVYINYQPEKRESFIRPVTTNGAAAGDTYERAACAAICENIERDAFCIFWLNKIALPEIDKNTLRNNQIKKLISEFERLKIEVRFFDITTDVGIPTVFVLSIDRSGKRFTVRCSVATRFDYEEALLHALCENIKALQSTFKFITGESIAQARAIYPNIETLIQRVSWWARPEAIEDIEWMLAGKTKPLPQPLYGGASYKAKLGILKSSFERINQEVYLADTTSSLSARYGLRVVMSLIPGFYPLYLKEQYKYLGIQRMYDLPVKLGYLNIPRKESELNSIPHPMA